MNLYLATALNITLTQERDSIKSEYSDASKVIAEQQRKITESMEKEKLVNSLAQIEQEKRNHETQENEKDSNYDVWEEVQEAQDDDSGNLVSQRRKEISQYQWKPDFACKKCDKVLDSDQQFRHHIKEYNRLIMKS